MAGSKVYSFTGSVDAAGDGLVTIVVDAQFQPRCVEGDKVHVNYTHDDRPEHECDWRFYGRRPDGLADIICVAEGHGEGQLRAAAQIVSNHLLPKYEGQFDLPKPTHRFGPQR